MDRCTAGGSESDDDRFPLFKVVVPFVGPWIKQRHDGSGLAVNARQIRAFAQVTPRATQSEVGKLRETAVLLGDDMIDLETCERQGRLRQAAVFAAVSGPMPHLYSQLLVHQTEVVRARTTRALA